MRKISRYIGVIIILFLCLIAAILYFCGFRITYAPELNNNWDAISACAGWAGVFASGFAIFVAIGIPNRIAEQQNGIALFDKRYSAFNSFAFLTSAMKYALTNEVAPENKKVYLDKMIRAYESISVIRELTSDYEKPSDIYIRLILEAGKIQYVFELAEMEIVIDFLFAADKYIADIYAGKPVSDMDLRIKYNNLISRSLQEKLEAQLKL